MRPATHTIQELFERDVRFAVPLYQRPYVWNEEHQWAPLWTDVEALLDHQAADDAQELWSHFLGAIVLENQPQAPGQIPRYVVIDGQQRLTTLQLLLAAAAQSLRAVGAGDDAALLAELTLNNPLKAKGTDRLKVWPTNANRVSFVAVMDPDGPPPGHVDDAANLIDEAFAYFAERTADYLADDEATGADAVAARARRLRVTLCDLLKVVSITLEQDDNAQVIFETLNARGTPLLALDLTKNAVFAEASRQGREPDELYERVWRPQLDDEYWRVERRQGRLNRPMGELFLMHWLTMRTERPVPATELFATFRQRVLASSSDAEALVRELCDDAAVMRSFDTPAPGSPEAWFFRALVALDAGTILPLVMLLFRSPEVTVQRRRRALKTLESWLARRALMRLTAKNYNRLVPALVAAMKADLPRADEILRARLAGGAGEISRWPSDAEFRQHLLTRDIYGWVSQPRIAMALAAVEQTLHSNKVDMLDVPSTLSIEHLMPQTWHETWPLVDDRGAPLTGAVQDAAAEARGERLHRLGNLTIVTVPLNSSMTNAPWPRKRAELNRHSKLLLNAVLAERDRWDEQAIDERTAWLAERLIEFWPGPDPGDQQQ